MTSVARVAARAAAVAWVVGGVSADDFDGGGNEWGARAERILRASEIFARTHTKKGRACSDALRSLEVTKTDSKVCQTALVLSAQKTESDSTKEAESPRFCV